LGRRKKKEKEAGHMSQIGKYQVLGQAVIGNKVSGRQYELHVGYRDFPFIGSLIGDGEELKHGDIVNYGKIIGDSNLIIIFPNYGGSSRPGGAGVVIPGYEPIDWYQSLVNSGLNCFLNGTYNVPDLGAAELISPFNTDSQDGAGMGRCLGVVSIGPAWVHCYYVANSGFTGFDKIRVRARLHSNNTVLWTYDIAISTITNATNTSIPTTSNLFWDDAIKHLIIIDFRFYAISIPDPLVAPVSFVERNQTARRGAGYAGNGVDGGTIFHHTGSGSNLYKFNTSTGFSAAVGSNNFNSGWSSGFTPFGTFSSNLLDVYRFFNRSGVFCKNRWHVALTATKTASGFDQGMGQLRLFSCDQNGVYQNKLLFESNYNDMEKIKLDELFDAIESYYSSISPIPDPPPAPSLNGYTKYIWSGIVSVPYYWVVGSVVKDFSTGEVTGLNITSEGTETDPLHNSGGLMPMVACPRPNHAVVAGSGLYKSEIFDIHQNAYISNSQSVYHGLIKQSENVVCFACIENCFIQICNGSITSSNLTGFGLKNTSIVPNIGWMPWDAGPTSENTVIAQERFETTHKTTLFYVDVSNDEPVILKRLEISERGLRSYPYKDDGDGEIQITKPLPVPCNVWQIAAIENGPFAGSIITLQDSYIFEENSNVFSELAATDYCDDPAFCPEPMLRFKIINPNKEISYTSPAFGPPRAKIPISDSNGYLRNRNIYQICAFKTGVSTVRTPQIGTPQLRVISPNDGSPPILIIGVWAERIDDGNNSANYTNDHFLADIWIYRIESLTAPVLLKHFSEAKKTITEFTLPRGSDFERMVFSNGSLKYVNFQNNTRKLMVL
jgi:hypothetical protein